MALPSFRTSRLSSFVSASVPRKNPFASWLSVHLGASRKKIKNKKKGINNVLRTLTPEEPLDCIFIVALRNQRDALFHMYNYQSRCVPKQKMGETVKEGTSVFAFARGARPG